VSLLIFLEKVLELDPAEKYLVDAYTTLAYAYQRKKEFDEIPAVYEGALAELPDNARLMYSYASAIFRSKPEDLYEKGLELNK
jgi:Tfp pilus assembly protein PilF